MNNEAIEQKAVGGASRKLQLVLAGQDQFGIFADQISAIVEWQEPAPLPHAPTSVLGVVCIQGRMLTVLDLAKLAGADAVSADSPRTFPKHLIALRGDEQLALAVEGLGEVVQLTSNARGLHRRAGNCWRSCAQGLAAWGRRNKDSQSKGTISSCDSGTRTPSASILTSSGLYEM